MVENGFVSYIKMFVQKVFLLAMFYYSNNEGRFGIRGEVVVKMECEKVIDLFYAGGYSNIIHFWQG